MERIKQRVYVDVNRAFSHRVADCTPMPADATLLLVLILVGAVIAVLWLLLPFAVFGIKPLVERAIREQTETRRLLGDILAELKRANDASKR